MTAILETVVKSNEPAQKSSADRASKQKPVLPRESEEAVRYFLSKENGITTVPQLGKEFPGEKEAMIEALRTGLSFFAVSEWKAIPDFSGRNPQVIKQAVNGKAHL
jgi:hypothetical protein